MTEVMVSTGAVFSSMNQREWHCIA